MSTHDMVYGAANGGAGTVEGEQCPKCGAAVGEAAGLVEYTCSRCLRRFIRVVAVGGGKEYVEVF